MFRILILDKRDTIHLVMKYLLYKYELEFSPAVADAAARLKKSNIDMLVVTLPLDNAGYAELEELICKKKIILITDTADAESADTAKKLGAVECIDKLEISRLPRLVEKHLNQAVTKVVV